MAKKQARCIVMRKIKAGLLRFDVRNPATPWVFAKTETLERLRIEIDSVPSRALYPRYPVRLIDIARLQAGRGCLFRVRGGDGALLSPIIVACP